MYLPSRLRSAPLSVFAFAVLCFVTTCVTAVLPRAVDAYGDAALRDVLTGAPAEATLLSGTLPVQPGVDSDGDLVAPALRPERVDAVGGVFARAAARTLPVGTGPAVAGVRNPVPVPVGDPDLPRLTESRPPELTLTAPRALAAHSRPVEGELPGPEVRVEPPGRSGNDVHGGSQRVDAVVTARTAHRMGLEPGDSVAFGAPTTPGEPGFRTVLTLTGVVEPRDPDHLFWTADPVTAQPRRASAASGVPGNPPDRFWRFGALVHRDAAKALLGSESGAEAYWHFSLPTDDLHAAQVPELADGLTSLARGPEATALAREAGAPVTVDESLGTLLGGFARDRSAVAPLLAMAAAGVLTTALVVVLLWSVLAAGQRRDELVLLRARGGSLHGLVRWSLAETVACGLPAAVAGYGAAVWLVPDARTAASLLAAATTAAVALLATPLSTAWLHRRPLGAASEGDRTGRGRGRLVAEATVLTLTTGAVVALRQRGVDEGATDTDPFTAAAPVLLALTAALLLLRCCPRALRLLSRAAARRPGAVGFLGLARAGRPASAVVAGLPLLGLLSALTMASFGGTVLAGVADARDRAALAAVGADARIASPGTLAPELAERVRKADGVRDVSPVRTFENASLLSGLEQPTLVIVDPASYARLAAHTGLGAYPAGALDDGGTGDGGTGDGGTGDGAVPALVSAEVYAERVGGPMRLVAPGLRVSVRPEVVREATPAAPQGSFVVVSRKALEKAQPDLAGSALAEPDTLLVDTEDGGAAGIEALRALTERADAALSLNLAAEERAAYGGSALRSGAERLYRAAVLVAAVLSAVAVLLSLAQSAPERAAVLARLRALGMPRRQGSRLVLVEALPLYVLTAAAGVLLALVSVPLLRPGIDLVALAGTPEGTPAPLSTAVLPLLLPALCLLLLTVLALLVQGRVAARRTDARLEST
ncbi:FtsX-like permease family protein [Streptomyces sp. DSM 42041]|uniref:FtsX-like permease family protein n=1 Tax=Streptomyces hazeniae TaxID=3075538 RepID=A0ABU2NKY0_9ACTN|nr:FtsX-like permease family protein [Streptomyces sp. DSM 42041]MDT0377645.1 FtsX-like permease family protein [Streptomyces sp. DSM 42041]